MRIAGLGRCAGLALLSLTVGLAAATAAEPNAKQPKSPWAALIAEIVPDDAPARPPFQLGRYDAGIRWREKSQPSAEAMTGHAAARQERLRELWIDICDVNPAIRGPAQRAEERLLSYAMGQSELDEALQAAHKAGSAAQFRLARLLLAECRFDAAVKLLAAIADQPGGSAGKDFSRQALTLLARHDAERSALAVHLPLVPLDFDLSGFLKRQGHDPARRALIEAARQTVVVRLPDALRPESTYETVDIGDVEESPPAELDVEPAPGATQPVRPRCGSSVWPHAAPRRPAALPGDGRAGVRSLSRIEAAAGERACPPHAALGVQRPDPLPALSFHRPRRLGASRRRVAERH